MFEVRWEVPGIVLVLMVLAVTVGVALTAYLSWRVAVWRDRARKTLSALKSLLDIQGLSMTEILAGIKNDE